MENRAEILLKATLDILTKCDNSSYVLDVLSETSFYDGTDCDGYCLMEDIKNYLEFGCWHESHLILIILKKESTNV